MALVPFPQPSFNATPYPPHQPGPYKGGPAPGGRSLLQIYTVQSGFQQIVNTAVGMQGPAPGGYPAAPQYYPGQPGPQKMVNTAVRMQGPAPGGYPSVPQYNAGQPRPQQMGPAPGVYAPSPQCITEQPAPQNVGLSSVQPIGHGNSGIRKENSSQGTKMRFEWFAIQTLVH